MKSLICKLFGHKMDFDIYFNHNAQVCLRCGDVRDSTYNYYDQFYWTDLQYYGLIGYPIWKIKNYILAAWIWIKLKTGKLKIYDKNKDDYDPDLPF